MSQVEFKIPNATELAVARDTVAQLAPDLQQLWTDENSAIVDTLFEGLQFPQLTQFSYHGCAEIAGMDSVLSQFTQLVKLKIWPSPQTQHQDEELINYLVQSACWERLTHVEFWFGSGTPQPEQFSSWSDLWAGRSLSVEHLNFNGATHESVTLLLQASFSHLTYLQLSSGLTDPILPLILEAKLPALEILDLRFNSISGEGLNQFARSVPEHLPCLRQVGVEMFTGERVEYYDWNGAVVDGCDVTLTPEEISDRYLQGTSLSVMTTAPEW